MTRRGPHGTLITHCRTILTGGATAPCPTTAGPAATAVLATAEAEKRRLIQAASRTEVVRCEAGPIKAVGGRALAAITRRRRRDRLAGGRPAKKAAEDNAAHATRPTLAH